MYRYPLFAQRLRFLKSVTVFLAGIICSSPSWAEKVGIDVEPSADSLRLVFSWPDSVNYSASFSDGVLYIDFSRPINDLPNLTGISRISNMRLENRGKRLRLDIAGAQSLRPVADIDPQAGRIIAIDILSDPQKGTRQIIQGLSVGAPSASMMSQAKKPTQLTPSSQPDKVPNKLPDLSPVTSPIQAADSSQPLWPAANVQADWLYHGQTPRLIFDWPIPTRFVATIQAHEANIRFDAPARINGLQAIRMSNLVEDIQVVTEGQSTRITLTRNPDEGSFFVSSLDGRLMIDMVVATRSQLWEVTGVLKPAQSGLQPGLATAPSRSRDEESMTAEDDNLAPISPFYMGARLGVSWMRLSRIHDISMDRDRGRVIIDQRDAPVFGADVALGLSGIESDSPVRAEIAYLYRSPFAYDPSRAALGGTEASIDGQVSAHALMANAYLDLNYDPNSQKAWGPYLMIGVGPSLIMSEANIRDSEAGQSAGEVSDDDVHLAWGLGGGLSYPVSQRIRFDTGYRYLRLGGTSFGPSERLSQGDRLYVKVRRIEAHELSFGLRYAFP